jgi:branched-chain amino acid transport system permease protein
MSIRLTRPALALAAVVALLALVPLLLDAAGAARYLPRLLVIGLLYVSCAVAWDLVGGLAGQVSFGHATFFGVGAFTAAILVRAGVPLAITLAPAAALAAAYAALWGWPCLRLRGPFFAIATIGVGEATRLVALSLETVTGGATGLTLPVAGGRHTAFYLALGLAAIAVAASSGIRRSRLGLGLSCIREEVDAAESIGIPIGRLQLQALMVSAAIVGAAGAVYARYLYYVEPGDVFSFNRSIGFILMAIIGGVNTLWGPAAGAVLFLALEQVLLSSFPSLHLGIYGLLLIAVMLFEPQGLLAAGRRLRRAPQA